MYNALSDNFFVELRKPVHTIAIKAAVLNTRLQPVEAGEFYNDKTNKVQSFIIDGSVDIDVTRGTRRTGELTLLNKDGEFSPNSDWTGLFYLNRVVRMFRGVVYEDGEAEFAPIGTFLVDHAEVIVERNMSLVVLAMSDFWKKLSKSAFTSPHSYADNTHINDIIRAAATYTGADYPNGINLDPLHSRTDAERRIHSKTSVERGDNRGEFIKDLCNHMGIDIYFDAMGKLTTQDRTTQRDRDKVWEYYQADDGSGGLISVRRSFNDDNLYNHVIAVGTANEKLTVTKEIKDTSPTSLTSIDKIGDRVLIIETDKVGTQAVIDRTAKIAWEKRTNIADNVTAEVICNPALEGDDVVKITEGFAKLHTSYRIKQMNVPLVTTKQTIQLENVIRR